ncbi:hypothetical protein MNBD_ACTINO01-2096, partial [hydrothermal vent metagenome]
DVVDHTKMVPTRIATGEHTQDMAWSRHTDTVDRRPCWGIPEEPVGKWLPAPDRNAD